MGENGGNGELNYEVCIHIPRSRYELHALEASNREHAKVLRWRDTAWSSIIFIRFCTVEKREKINVLCINRLR